MKHLLLLLGLSLAMTAQAQEGNWSLTVSEVLEFERIELTKPQYNPYSHVWTEQSGDTIKITSLRSHTYEYLAEKVSMEYIFVNNVLIKTEYYYSDFNFSSYNKINEDIELLYKLNIPYTFKEGELKYTSAKGITTIYVLAYNDGYLNDLEPGGVSVEYNVGYTRIRLNPNQKR